MRTRQGSRVPLLPRDARLRFGLGVAGFILAAAAVRPDRIDPNERRVFGAINRLPDSLGGPFWLVMQGGNFAAAQSSVTWLDINRDNLSGKVLALPKREDVNLPVNEQLIVELYSK